MRKICGKCGALKSRKEFAINKAKPDGLNWQCRACQAAYHKEHYQRNKKRYIRQAHEYRDRVLALLVSLKKVCSVCGADHPATLDFHHRDPGKKDGQVYKFAEACSPRKLLAEISKCDVLCANCHRKLHWGDPRLAISRARRQKIAERV